MILEDIILAETQKSVKDWKSPIKINMKRRYIYLPLFFGVVTPSLVIFTLQIFVAGMSPLNSVVDIIRRQFAEGHNLFILMLLGFIPFGALMILTWLVSLKSKGTRLECIFWGGFDYFRKELEIQKLKKSADLYSEVYSKDSELQDLSGLYF